MTTTSERWSVMTVDEKFEEITARASALNARQDALLARMKAFSARTREEPLTGTDAAEFGALITENTEIDGKLLALRMERASLGNLPVPGLRGWIGRLIGRGYTPLSSSPK
jgi:hypothetical protein